MAERTIQSSPQVFRVNRRFLLFVDLFGLIVGGFLLGIALTSKDAIFGLWWMRILTAAPLLLFLLGLQACIAAFREKIIIDGNEIIFQGIFRARHFRFSEVSALEWGTKAKRFVVRFNNKAFEICTSNYSRKDFNRMVSLFRAGVPTERQFGWHLFCLVGIQRMMIDSNSMNKDARDAIQKLADQGGFDAVQALESLLDLDHNDSSKK